MEGALTGEGLVGGTEGDLKKTATYRALLGVVILLGVLIVLAMIALVVGGVMKMAGKHGANASLAAVELPAGARIEAVQTTSDRLILELATPQGREVDIYDPESGRLVARLKPAPPAVPK